MTTTILSDQSYVEKGKEYKDYGHVIKQIVRGRTSLKVTDDRVTFYNSSLITAETRSGYQYWRWETDSLAQAYLTSKGNVAYRKKSGKAFCGINPTDTELLNLPAAWSDAVKENFNLETLTHPWPIIDMYMDTENAAITRMPSLLLPAARNDDFKDFVAQTFGKNNVRRDLVRAAASNNPAIVMYFSRFKNLVPVDWIVEGLNKTNEVTDDGYLRIVTALNSIWDWNNVWTLNKAQKPATLRRLVRNGLTPDEAGNFMDIAKWKTGGSSAKAHHWRTVPVADTIQRTSSTDFRSWREIHNRLYDGRANRRPAEVRTTPRGAPVILTNEAEVQQIDLAKKIDGAIVNGMSVYTAKTVGDMRNWSTVMNNCISDYVYEARAGRGIYGAIMKGEEVYANFEVKNDKHLAQLLGNRNSTLPLEDQQVLEQYFTSKGIDCSNYWGQSRVNQENLVREDYNPALPF